MVKLKQLTLSSVLGLGLLGGVSQDGFADPAPGSPLKGDFRVSLTVEKGCAVSFSDTDLVFKSRPLVKSGYSKDEGTSYKTTDLKITCTKGTSYAVKLQSTNKMFAAARVMLKDGVPAEKGVRYTIKVGSPLASLENPSLGADDIPDLGGIGDGKEKSTKLYMVIFETYWERLFPPDSFGSYPQGGEYSDRVTAFVSF